MVNIDEYKDYETLEYHLVYTALINAARARGTVTYQELAQLVGLPLSGNLMGKRVGALLGAVSLNEVNHDRPMLSALAVTVGGVPGPGFYLLAREMNRLRSEQAVNELAFWEEQKTLVYQTWQQKFAKQGKSNDLP